MTVLWFSLVGVMAALSWRHARSQSPVRVGRPETPARTVQLSSVAPERVSEPTHTRLGDTATLAPATHKERGSAGYPTGRRVTLGGAPCACVANAPAAQLPSSSEPSCDRLGQLSRAEGDTARDAVPAPPGRAAGVHVDPRGPQPQGDLEDLAVEAGVREYVSRLWAEDWNSAEDSAYDAEAAS